MTIVNRYDILVIEAVTDGRPSLSLVEKARRVWPEQVGHDERGW
jgi:hypothetical protein